MSNTESTSLRPLPYFIDFSALYRRAEAISHAYLGGNLVFFLGAGASKAFQPKFPSWPQLLGEVLAESQIPSAESDEIEGLISKGKYLLAAEALRAFADVDRPNRDEAMDRRVSDILERRISSDGDFILHLGVLDFATPVVTTNFDTILERVIRQQNLDNAVSVFTFQDDTEIAARLDPTESQSPYIFKLHGSAGKSLILDEGDYADLYFRGRWPRAIALLQHLLATKMVIFVGFSLSDPEIMPLLREATRHASSYQHLAFLKESDVTKIERQVLREHYRVDPILYQNHSELPLYILEMRNFHPRDRLTLQLAGKTSELAKAASSIRKAQGLKEDCSVVLFGSYAKYGDWISEEADLDLFFLMPSETKKVEPGVLDQKLLDRRVDATFLSRLEFEEALNQGDAFASSILVTGSPILDPKGIFALLARGLRPKYVPADLVSNARGRCQLRWLRLCALRHAERSVFIRACQQWSLTLMQLALMQRKPPTSLLEASLLGNARYVIREFVQRFKEADESLLLDIMRSTKGLKISRPAGWPELKEAVNSFRLSLRSSLTAFERDLLVSRDILPQAEPGEIAALFARMEYLLRVIDDAKSEASLPGKEEHALFNRLNGSDLHDQLSTFDWLFFFELHQLTSLAGLIDVKPADPKLIEIIKKHQTEWKEGKWGELINS